MAVHKLTPRKQWTIPGTDLSCWVSSMTVKDLEALDLGKELDSETRVIEALRQRLGEAKKIIEGHFWQDSECQTPLFEAGEINALSPAQLIGMAEELMDFSGLFGGSAEDRARFQDAPGEAGSVPDSPDGEGVRDAS